MLLATGAVAGASTKEAVSSEEQVIVGGNYLKAFTVVEAYLSTKMPSIPVAQKKLENYDILFYTTEHYYIVEFVPHRLPSEKHVIGCYYSLGRSMDFEVAKSDFAIAAVRPCF